MSQNRAIGLLSIIFYKIIWGIVEIISGFLIFFSSFFIHAELLEDPQDRFVEFLLNTRLSIINNAHQLGLLLIILGVTKLALAGGLWYRSWKMRDLLIGFISLVSLYAALDLAIKPEWYKAFGLAIDLFILYYLWRILPGHLDERHIISPEFKAKIENNLKTLVFGAIEYKDEHGALLVYDNDSAASRMLIAGYRKILPKAKTLNFNKKTPAQVIAMIQSLPPKTLVVMIQSTSFRLNEFRFRLELFQRKLAVVEHLHLGRMPIVEFDTFIDALEYDPTYYRTVGPALKTAIDKAQHIVVRCEGTELHYNSTFEPAKLNIGDYREMKNTGGQFPIGEVFTEPTDFDQMNGKLKLYAFGDAKFELFVPEKPFTVVIEKGILVDAPDAPPEFVLVMDQIRADELLWVRELGLGLNRALTRTRFLTDVGSYERMCGVHVSLGQKHTIYAKPGMPKRSSRYHVDVFVDVTEVEIDGQIVFSNGSYLGEVNKTRAGKST